MEKRKNGAMGLKRKPLQGVLNIIRFNWHFYLLAGTILILLPFMTPMLPPILQSIAYLGLGLMIATLAISLLVSFYIYDCSNLYQLHWLSNIDPTVSLKLLNINAGFDETSELLKHKFPRAEIHICDFYDPEKHTEVSIKRARKAYPPHPATIGVQTQQLPFPDQNFDQVLAILSAHEIRDEQERIQFFKELNRIIKTNGRIAITEHLRDINNFLVYNIGSYHFYSRDTWLKTFLQAGLIVEKEIKTTAFIRTFILKKGSMHSVFEKKS